MKRRRTKHNLSHYRLLTTDMGKLVPVGLVECLPGDTIQCDTRALVRFSPLAAPVMHPVEVRVHKFFVPHRLVFPAWEDFITGGPDGDDSTELPSGTYTTVAGDLFDYYGVEPGIDASLIQWLPIYGYNAIFNEYYRDQDLVSPRGQDTIVVQNIAWEKDYFTSARPWSQKGPDVTLPLGAEAPVGGTGDSIPTFFADGEGNRFLQGSTGNQVQYSGTNIGSVENLQWDDPKLVADLAQATGISVNEFREYFAIQRYQENRARYGSRYTEYLRFLGVTPSDARLQRPEYLGGGKVAMALSEVLQTAPEIQQEQQREYGVGDLYGHGVGALRTRPHRYFIEEHGYLHILMSIRPRTMYVNAMDRHWLKRDKEQFFQPELAHLGQQEIFNAEVYGQHSQARETFGFQDRYDEYRFATSKVSGQFREVLNYWHIGRDFESEPALNEAFVECVPTKRIFNEQTQDSCWVMVNNRVAARRLVSREARPRIL